MAYKNGIYVAFDGGGDTNIETGDIKYYNLMKAWKENDNIDFEFINSHDKTRDVRDDSSWETLKNVLATRINNSKAMIVISSEQTRENNRALRFEIEKAQSNGIKILLILIMSDNLNDELTYLISFIKVYDKVQSLFINSKYYKNDIDSTLVWRNGIMNEILSWIKKL